jgi:ribosomal protein S18 acetylase RimI-like enzyme
MEITAFTLTSVDAVELIEPLWNSLREHYESLADRPGDVYDRPESWRRRKATYTKLLEGEGGRIVGLSIDDELVAYAALGKATTSPVFKWSERATMIETFVVSDRHRSAGLGKKLMEMVRADARKRGDDELLLLVTTNNHAAIDFYRDVGFGPYCLLLSDAVPQVPKDAE